MMLVSIAGCLFSLAVSLAIAYTRLGYRGVIAYAVVAFILPCGAIIISPVLVINSAVIGVVALLCQIYKAEFVTFVKWSTASVVTAFVVPTFYFYWEVRQQDALRAEYAFESMDDRLAYERERLPAANAAELDEATENRLLQVEQQVHYQPMPWLLASRRDRLRMLHQSAQRRFVNNPGFGFGRMNGMLTVDENDLKLPDPPKLHMPTEAVCLDDAPTPADDTASSSDENSETASDGPALWESHLNSIVNFVNEDGFGYIRDREHVAGFQSHRFSEPPAFKNVPADSSTAWQLVRLELVSLLKHEEPKVYVSEYLPRMDELADTAVRDLSPFESQALADLKSGEDLTIDSQPDRIRMVGSLRAADACTSCHLVQRGMLLGAFSYELLPAPPVSERGDGE